MPHSNQNQHTIIILKRLETTLFNFMIVVLNIGSLGYPIKRIALFRT